MSAAYVLIGFENKQVTEVERALITECGDDALRIPALGIRLSVASYAEEYRTADKFLEEHGLSESNLFLREFDILPFSTEIHLECMRGRLIGTIMEVVADVLAATLTKRLNTRALVRIADGEVPFRLYSSNGAIEIDYVDWYRTIFRERAWIPISLRRAPVDRTS